MRTNDHPSQQRTALIASIRRFPARLRLEQLRGWLILAFIALIYLALLLAWLWLTDKLLIRLTANWTAKPLISLLTTGLAAWLYYKTVGVLFRHTFETFYAFLGVRPNPFRAHGVADVIAVLEHDVPFGLYLRSFQDEDTVVPTSREKIASVLDSLAVPFVTVDNSQATGRQPATVLSVPNSQWRQTIFSLAELSTVIVIDTSTAMPDWLDGLPDELGGWQSDFEVYRRAGMVDELERLVAVGSEEKAVVCVPPGWPDMLASGEIAEHIRREEHEARKRRDWVLSVRGKRATQQEKNTIEWFTRTRIKRVLPHFPRVVTDPGELRRHIEAIVAKSRPEHLRGSTPTKDDV